MAQVAHFKKGEVQIVLDTEETGATREFSDKAYRTIADICPTESGAAHSLLFAHQCLASILADFAAEEPIRFALYPFDHSVRIQTLRLCIKFGKLLAHCRTKAQTCKIGIGFPSLNRLVVELHPVQVYEVERILAFLVCPIQYVARR